MVVSRHFRETVVARLETDPEFGRELLREANRALLIGEPDVCRALLRDLVNGTVGFVALSDHTGIPVKSAHHMLSTKGNPTMAHLAGVFQVLAEHLGGITTVLSVPPARQVTRNR